MVLANRQATILVSSLSVTARKIAASPAPAFLRTDGAGPEHGLHVHVVFYPAELVRVLVNNHNLLLLFGQALRNVEPHFPRSHDDDLEFFNLLGSTTKQHKASNNAYRMDFALKQQFIARIQTTAV